MTENTIPWMKVQNNGNTHANAFNFESTWLHHLSMSIHCTSVDTGRKHLYMEPIL